MVDVNLGGAERVRTGRAVPTVTADDEPYWTGGAEGELRIQRCRSCEQFQHPAGPVCHRCLSSDVGFEAVSGTGTIYSSTINYQPWLPDLDVPLAIVVVELAEQAGLRLVSRLIDVDLADDPSAAAIGRPVVVNFVRAAPESPYYLPFFTLEVSQ